MEIPFVLLYVSQSFTLRSLLFICDVLLHLFLSIKVEAKKYTYTIDYIRCPTNKLPSFNHVHILSVLQFVNIR